MQGLHCAGRQGTERVIMFAARLGAVAGGFTATIYVYSPQRWEVGRRQIEASISKAAAFNLGGHAQSLADAQWAGAATKVEGARTALEGHKTNLVDRLEEQTQAFLTSASAALPPSRVDYVQTILPTGARYDGSVLEQHPIVAVVADVLAPSSELKNVPIPDGYGQMSYPNGDVYSGAFRNGLREGRGQLLGARGDLLVGEWKAGCVEGRARWVSGSHDAFSTDATANGDVFEGQFVSGLPGPTADARFVSRRGEVVEGKDAAARAFEAMGLGKENFIAQEE
eukprot:COSAG05_NODE_720_length_7779_cov_9.749740_2_plen_282_part_00